MAFKAKTHSNKYQSHTTQDAITEAVKEELVGLSIKISKHKRSAFKAKTAINNDNMQDVILRAIDSYGLIKYKVDLFCYVGRIRQKFYQFILCLKLSKIKLVAILLTLFMGGCLSC